MAMSAGSNVADAVPNHASIEASPNFEVVEAGLQLASEEWRRGAAAAC
jgi:hypothetical protein